MKSVNLLLISLIITIPLWLQGCVKHSCSWTVPVHVYFEQPRLDLVREIELKIWQKGKVVMPDIVRPEYFKNNIYDYTYPLMDLTNDSLTITRRVYAHDKSWVEYRHTIAIQ